MQSTGVLLGLGSVVLIGLGVVTGLATASAIQAGASLTAPAAWGLASAAAALALAGLSIRRLRAIVRVAERLAQGELEATIP
jgi:hypothetical protein